MLIKVKMPTIFGILTFMSRINFVLAELRYVGSFNQIKPLLFVQQNHNPMIIIHIGMMILLIKRKIQYFLVDFLHLIHCVLVSTYQFLF